MNPIRFTVFGKPETKGSTRSLMGKRADGGTYIRTFSDNPKLKAWQNAVALGGVQARGVGRLAASCGIDLEVAFYLPRPLQLAKKATPQHTTRPDLDKLGRAIGDALKGVLWEDDGQIVKLTTTKSYAELGEEPRAVITVRPADLALFRHLGERVEAHK